MDFVDNVSEAEQRNNITIVKNYDSATIEAMNAAAKEINERAIKYISPEDAADVQTVSDRLACGLYTDMECVFAESGKIFTDGKFYTAAHIDKAYIWYSSLSNDYSVLNIQGDGRWDPIAEILMSPSVLSLADAEDIFISLYVYPYMDRSAQSKYAVKLLRLAFRAMCSYLLSDKEKSSFPQPAFEDSMRDFAFVLQEGTCTNADIFKLYEEMTVWDNDRNKTSQVTPLLVNAAEACESIRLPIRNFIIKVAQNLSKARKESLAAGISSVWRSTQKYMLVDIDKLSLQTLRQVTEISKLYDIKQHILITPDEWACSKRSYFSLYFDACESAIAKTALPNNSRYYIPDVFPSDCVSRLRKKIVEAMNLGEEHRLTEVRVLRDEDQRPDTKEHGLDTFFSALF